MSACASAVSFEQASPLTDLLDRRPWVLCNDPFPHIRAHSVFAAAFHRELAAAFATILDGRPLATWPEARFSRNMPGYDASAVDFDIRVGWPFSVFVSRAWHDLFARLFAVEAVGCVSGALHHHQAGGRDGYVHNDLNPGWFVDTRNNDDEIVIPRSDLCHYRYGSTRAAANVPPRETIRGIAIIYYVNNAEWRAGDGGETGLYRTTRDPVAHPVVAVPPLNNSLVAFECTPHSFHTFRTNRHPRNSVIVWLHRAKTAVLDRWGHSAIVGWP